MFIQHGGDVIENLTHSKSEFLEKLELARNDGLSETRPKVSESGSNLTQMGGIDKQMLINNIKSLNGDGEYVVESKNGAKYEPGVQYDEDGRPYRNHVLEKWKTGIIYSTRW